MITTGRSGLVVAYLTAVREVLWSNCAVGSCVYHKKPHWFTALGTGCVHLSCNCMDTGQVSVCIFLCLSICRSVFLSICMYVCVDRRRWHTGHDWPWIMHVSWQQRPHHVSWSHARLSHLRHWCTTKTCYWYYYCCCVTTTTTTTVLLLSIYLSSYLSSYLAI